MYIDYFEVLYNLNFKEGQQISYLQRN